jgi:hypothetical protein
VNSESEIDFKLCLAFFQFIYRISKMSESLRESINVLLAAQHSRCEIECVINENGAGYYWTIDSHEPADVDNEFVTVEEAIASLIQYLEPILPSKYEDCYEDYEYEQGVDYE